jgi:hypothetical protein
MTKRPLLGAAGPIAKAGAAGLLTGALMGAATAWVGFSTGSREDGFLSGTGYVIGSLGALGAFSGLVALGLLGLAVANGPPAPTTRQAPSESF